MSYGGSYPSFHDLDICCDEKAFCLTFTCPYGFISKIDEENKLLCTSAFCNEQMDLNICCNKKASCQDYVCPNDFEKKMEIDKEFCFKKFCDESDTDICCEESKILFWLNCFVLLLFVINKWI